MAESTHAWSVWRNVTFTIRHMHAPITFEGTKLTYLVYRWEVDLCTGKRCSQGYCQFEVGTTFEEARWILGSGDWVYMSKSHNTKAVALAYIKRDGCTVYEHGHWVLLNRHGQPSKAPNAKSVPKGTPTISDAFQLVVKEEKRKRLASEELCVVCAYKRMKRDAGDT